MGHQLRKLHLGRVEGAAKGGGRQMNYDLSRKGVQLWSKSRGTCAALMSSLLSTGRIHKSCVLDYESLKVFVFSCVSCFGLRLSPLLLLNIKVICRFTRKFSTHLLPSNLGQIFMSRSHSCLGYLLLSCFNI